MITNTSLVCGCWIQLKGFVNDYISVSHRYQFGLLPTSFCWQVENRTFVTVPTMMEWLSWCFWSSQAPRSCSGFVFCSISELPVAFGVSSTWRSSCQYFLMSRDGALAGLAADSLQKWISFCVGSPPLPESLEKQDSNPHVLERRNLSLWSV